jgi:hypothetical protein
MMDLRSVVVIPQDEGEDHLRGREDLWRQTLLMTTIGLLADH